MLRSTAKRLVIALALLGASPLFLRADNPAASNEKMVYSKPTGVAEKTRTPYKASRDPLNKHIPEGLSLIMLCPDHTGLTIQEHPSVFWFMNKPVKDVKFKLSVTAEGEPEPLLEKVWDAKEETGIQRIDLKDIAKALEPNTDYAVKLSILLDDKGGSVNPLTSGLIKRIPAPEKLVSKLLTRPTPAERAVVYARQGIWYDALSAISDQIAAEPNNKALHKERAELLKQGDLNDVAAYDESLGSN